MANDDHVHVALPKLYGAPAYARPPAQPVQRAARPFDPDELPLESAWTDEERQLVETPGGHPAAGSVSVAVPGEPGARPLLRGRPFSLKSITGRLLGDESHTDA